MSETWTVRSYWSGDRDPWGWFVASPEGSSRRMVPDKERALTWESEAEAVAAADSGERPYQIS